MSMRPLAKFWIMAIALTALSSSGMLRAQQAADPDEGYAPPRPAAAQKTTAAPDPDNGYAPPRIPSRSAAPGAPTAAPAGDAGLPPAPAPGQKDAVQDETQQEREWLVAYLIAHHGYRIDQMDQLEKRIDRMSATQVHTLVDLYQQKHELALQREKANQMARHQAYSAQTADYNQRLQDEQTARKEIDNAANAEQTRLNTQQSQAMQNIQESNLFHGPAYMNYGNSLYGGYGAGYGGGMYYDRYWH